MQILIKKSFLLFSKWNSDSEASHMDGVTCFYYWILFKKSKKEFEKEMCEGRKAIMISDGSLVNDDLITSD